MVPLKISLEAETMQKIEMAAASQQLSVSEWAREQLNIASKADSKSAWDHLSKFAGTVDDTFNVIRVTDS